MGNSPAAKKSSSPQSRDTHQIQSTTSPRLSMSAWTESAPATHGSTTTSSDDRILIWPSFATPTMKNMAKTWQRESRRKLDLIWEFFLVSSLPATPEIECRNSYLLLRYPA